MKLLDEKGLTTVWAAIKNTFLTKSAASSYAKTADVNTALAKKVDAVSGKGLSTNDFTAAYKSKLDGIASGANNYTLPVASTTTLGGIKVSAINEGTSWPINVDENGIANTCIQGLDKNNDNSIGQITIEGQSMRTTYNEQEVQITYICSNKPDSVFTFPSKSGTFALTSDLIKTNYSGNTPINWPVKVDKNNNAYVQIEGLVRGSNNAVSHLSVYSSNANASYTTDSIICNSREHGSFEYYFPEKNGTFALTSDISNVSDLCKINFVDRPSNCVEGRINMFTTTDRSISLNNIQDCGEGLILLLGCYSDSQYTIYCTDSDLYYKGVLVYDGYRKDITKAGMYLVTIKGSSVYVYPLG